MNNPKRIQDSAASEIADILFVSKTSIINLTKKLGFEGYSELKYYVKDYLRDKDKDKHNVTYEVILNNLNTEVSKTISLQSKENINNIVQKILNSRIVYVIARGASGPIASLLSSRLALLNVKAILIEDPNIVDVQMRVGGFEMRSYDEKIPLKHGLVGQETCGPGGFAYGMRSIQPMIHMVKKIREWAPEAWILNYTNPAAIVAVAMDMVFPEDKRLLNMCDQPYSMIKSFAKILEVDMYDLEPRYFGLNHFGWFTKLYNTKTKEDLLPKLKDFLINNEFKPFNAEQRDPSWLETYKRVNTMMSYFPEYIPNTYLQYYFFANEIVAESNPEFTRADEAILGRENKILDMCKKAKEQNSIDGLPLLIGEVHGNMMVEVAESIAYDLNKVFVIMVKNDGIIPNIPAEAMVETAGELGRE